MVLHIFAFQELVQRLRKWYFLESNELGSKTQFFQWRPLFDFSSVQSLSRDRFFATQWSTARQASLSITNSWSPPKPMSIELVMPSSHLILPSFPSPPALNLSQHQGLFK